MIGETFVFRGETYLVRSASFVQEAHHHHHSASGHVTLAPGATYVTFETVLIPKRVPKLWDERPALEGLDGAAEWAGG